MIMLWIWFMSCASFHWMQAGLSYVLNYWCDTGYKSYSMQYSVHWHICIYFFGLNKENIKECRAFGRLARKKRMNYYIPKSYQCSSIYIQYMFGQLWWFKWLWTTLVFSLLALTFRNERNKEPIDYWAPTTWQVGGKQ